MYTYSNRESPSGNSALISRTCYCRWFSVVSLNPTQNFNLFSVSNVLDQIFLDWPIGWPHWGNKFHCKKTVINTIFLIYIPTYLYTHLLPASPPNQYVHRHLTVRTRICRSWVVGKGSLNFLRESKWQSFFTCYFVMAAQEAHWCEVSISLWC